MPTQESGSTPPIDPGAVDAIARQVEELQKTYASMRKQIVMFSLLVLLLLVVFAVALFNRLRENLSEAKLSAAAQARMANMLPKVSEQLVIGLRDAAPTYGNLVMERAPKFAPVMGDRVSAAAQNLASQVNTDLSGVYQASMDRVAAKLEKDLEREFPKLDHAKLLTLGDKLKEEMVLPSEKLAQHIKDLTHEELTKVEKSLSKFPIDTYATMGNDELGRKLVHNLLMLVDYEVTQSGTHKGLDQAAPVQLK